MEYLPLVLGPCILIWLACCRWNIAFSAFCAGCVVAVSSGIGVETALFQYFSKGFADFAGQWILLFVAAAIFGRAMEASGMASRVASLAFAVSGRERAILAVMVISLLLSYGGVGTFVIAFVMVPITSVLFEKARLPEALMPAAILFCPTTLSMTMLPGSPSVQNLLPAGYLHTTIYAAPIPGLLCGCGAFLAGYAYLSAMSRNLSIKFAAIREKLPTESRVGISLFLPFLVVWAGAFGGVAFGMKSEMAVAFALCCGAIACLAGEKNWDLCRVVINDGIGNGLVALAITGAIMGFGAILKNMPGYHHLLEWIAASGTEHLAWDAVFINILAAVTGSSLASLDIFLSSFATRLLAGDIDPAILHRFFAIASSGLDSMPYASGVAVTLHLSGVGIKKAYPHIFFLCAILPLICTAGFLLWI